MTDTDPTADSPAAEPAPAVSELLEAVTGHEAAATIGEPSVPVDSEPPTAIAGVDASSSDVPPQGEASSGSQESPVDGGDAAAAVDDGASDQNAPEAAAEPDATGDVSFDADGLPIDSNGVRIEEPEGGPVVVDGNGRRAVAGYDDQGRPVDSDGKRIEEPADGSGDGTVPDVVESHPAPVLNTAVVQDNVTEPGVQTTKITTGDGVEESHHHTHVTIDIDVEEDDESDADQPVE